jgi:hypothetical protein
VAPAKRDGSVKMPDPIIEPTTIAISAGSASFWTVDSAIVHCLLLLGRAEGRAAPAGCAFLIESLRDTQNYHAL